LAVEEELERALELADAVVMTGCPFDLDPVRLGFEPHPATRSMPVRREDFDRRLCEGAVERKLPLLAIGSGMQLLNVVCGGTIHQHVTEDVPNALHHRDGVENNLRHLLEVVPGTRLDAIYGPGEIRVNSHHHMAVDKIAPDFKAAAAAPDGVVEAIEAASEDWFCVGVQWHPENASSSALDQQLFEQLADAARGLEPAVVPMTRRRGKKAVA
ncbi:MAG: gamma-glutamyl-gamma-aminobutyrate hydrolase family protein, partial [Planctomycetota bacterium]